MPLPHHHDERLSEAIYKAGNAQSLFQRNNRGSGYVRILRPDTSPGSVSSFPEAAAGAVIVIGLLATAALLGICLSACGVRAHARHEMSITPKHSRAATTIYVEPAAVPAVDQRCRPQATPAPGQWLKWPCCCV